MIKYVYLLNRMAFADRHHTGITNDLKARLEKHNSGEAPHTAKFKPWRLKTYLAFPDEMQAVQFENT